MYRQNRGEERREDTRNRRPQVKAEKKQRIPALELLMLVLGAVLIVALMFAVLDVNLADIPQTLKAIWWTVVAVIVAGLASWGM